MKASKDGVVLMTSPSSGKKQGGRNSLPPSARRADRQVDSYEDR